MNSTPTKRNTMTNRKMKLIKLLGVFAAIASAVATALNGDVVTAAGIAAAAFGSASAVGSTQ